MSYKSNQEWIPRPIPPQEDPYETGFDDKLYENDVPEDNPYEAEEPFAQFPPVVPERLSEPSDEPEKTPRKKHRILKILLWTFLSLLIFVILAGAVLHFFSHEPMYRKDGRKADCCTILLVGVDAESNNTDTLMLLQIDRPNRAISIMSIPRDTKVNSIYQPQKINGAYAANGCGKEGMDALMGYVADCIGFRPDGYILIDLEVFVELVDLFGGVGFDVPIDMYYDDPAQDLHIALAAGQRDLTGEEAMELIRFRSGYENADIGRISVQREFIKQAIGQWAKLRNILKLPAALWKIVKHTSTDLSVFELYWLAESVYVCGTDRIYSTVMPFYFNDVYVCVDLDQSYIDLINAHFNPYEQPVTWDDFDVAR